MAGCLWCGGWVGARPQGIFCKVSPASAHAQLNRVGGSPPKPEGVPVFFQGSVVQFLAQVSRSGNRVLYFETQCRTCQQNQTLRLKIQYLILVGSPEREGIPPE